MQGVVEGGEQGAVRQDPTCSREHQPGDDVGGPGRGVSSVPLPWRREDGVSSCRVGEGRPAPSCHRLAPATEVTGGGKANVATAPPALPGALGSRRPLGAVIYSVGMLTSLSLSSLHGD